MCAVFQPSRRNDIEGRGGGFLELCFLGEFRGTWGSKRDVGFQTGYTGSLLDILTHSLSRTEDPVLRGQTCSGIPGLSPNEHMPEDVLQARHGTCAKGRH